MKLLPCIFLMLVFTGSASAALAEVWSKQYNIWNYSRANDVATDSQNNVIAIGKGQNLTGSDVCGFLTIKYGPSGNILWTRNLTVSQEAYGVTTDSQDNIIVTGWVWNASGKKNGDFFTIKYDSNGNTIWTRNLTSSDGGIDIAYAVAADSQNNIIVTGRSTNATGTNKFDFFTIKYNPNGNLLWTKNYSSAGNSEAFDVVIDFQNNIIVTCRAPPTGMSAGNVFLTIKYDTNGNVLWMKSYSSGSSDTASGIALDSQNNIIVTGRSFNAAGTNVDDVLTIKYDTNGNVIWVRNYTASGYSNPKDVAIDPQDNIYIAGSTAVPGGFNNMWLMLKYDSNGNLLWTKNYTLPKDTRAEGIALDSNNNIIVAGYSAQQTGSGIYSDFLIIKYSEDNTPPVLTVSGGGTYTNTQTAIVTILGNEPMTNCAYSINDSAYSAMALIEGTNGAAYQVTFMGISGNSTNIVKINCSDLVGNVQTTATVVTYLFTQSPVPNNTQSNTQNQQQNQTCGNGVCESSETTAACPSDCVQQNQQGTQPNAASQATATESIEAGMTGTFNFPNFDVSAINVEVNDAAPNAKITAKKLSEVPDTVLTAPSTGTPYQFLEITTENLADTNVKKGVIAFKVQKKWLSDNSYDPMTVKLNRWSNNTWTTLMTTKAGEETENYKYTAETPGFSIFVITAGAAEQSDCSGLTCPPGYFLNTTNCTCISACTVDQYFDTTTNACQNKLSPAGPADLYVWILIVGVLGALLIAAFIYFEIIAKRKGGSGTVSVAQETGKRTVQEKKPVKKKK